MPDGSAFPPMPYLTAGFLAAALPRCRQPQAWVAPLTAACQRFGITTRLRLAAFAAQIGHESGDLNLLSESLDYTPGGLLLTWPRRFSRDLAERLGRAPGRPAHEQAIAEVVYGGRMGNTVAGDAWTYRGAGLLQLTGFDAHDGVAQAFGLATVDVPAWLRTRDGAAITAAWWWSGQACNTLADAEAIDAISRRINGGSIGLDDRRERYLRARRVLLP